MGAGLGDALVQQGRAEGRLEEEIRWPLGDLEAANRIRAICSAAQASVEKINGRAGKRQNRRDKKNIEGYEQAVKTAMEIAVKISDDLVRDAAVRQIISLCMIANNPTTAGILLRAIKAETFRKKSSTRIQHCAARRAIASN